MALPALLEVRGPDLNAEIDELNSAKSQLMSASSSSLISYEKMSNLPDLGSSYASTST